jgi:hypothetical protein
MTVLSVKGIDDPPSVCPGLPAGAPKLVQSVRRYAENIAHLISALCGFAADVPASLQSVAG